MKGNRTVIFDLDGVLFRTETVDLTAINKALSAHGYPAKSPDEILNCIGMTVQEMCESFGMANQEKIQRFERDLTRFEQEEIEMNGQMYDGAPEFIKRLKKKGYTICICSNGQQPYVTSVLEKFGIRDTFDEIWAQTDGYTKSQAVAHLKRKYVKDRFVMVGDRSVDIDAGRSNGGITIGSTYGFGDSEPFEADYTAGGIAELEKTIDDIFENENDDVVKEYELCVE